MYVGIVRWTSFMGTVLKYPLKRAPRRSPAVFSAGQPVFYLGYVATRPAIGAALKPAGVGRAK